jgi:hypothetical protein
MIQTLTSAAMIFMAAHVVVLTANAASITSANDYPSTLQSGQAANHRLLFTTPTGISEGSTITLSFSASFDTSSLVEDDVDVADDGVDLTTASTCGDTEQASVAIASDIVTITVCAGDGGAIAAGSQVTIEIGTNATASGTGANRVTNPSSAGVYFVTVAGTFGDDGSVALPIGGDDSVGVSVTVPSRGGGGGGVPASDTTAPTISDVLVSSITQSSATISWTTNEVSSSAADYGLTSSFELGTVSDGAYVVLHSLSLSGLSSGQTYYFRVRSSDSSGNQATSSTQTFVTTDTTAPVISALSATDITTSSARIVWTTDEASTSVVSYGLTSGYGASQSSSSLVTSHSVLLTGLAQATTYHYQVLSADALSNQSYSSDRTFTTNEDVAPANVSGLSAVSGDRTVTLSWSNPSDSDLAGVRVLSCVNAYPDSPTDSDCSILTNSLVTSFSHTGIVNGTIYYYGVFAFDLAGQFASGALVSGQPSAAEEEVPFEEEPEEEPGDEPGDDDAPAEEPGDEPGDEDGHGGDIPDELSGEPLSESSGGEILSSGETPTSLSAEESVFTQADISYLVADGEIELTATDSGVVEVLSTSTLSIRVQASEIGEDVTSVQVTIGDSSYLMRLDEARALYEAVVTLPSASDVYHLEVTVLASDSTEEFVSSYLRVMARGHVTQVIDGEEAEVANATVTLFENVGRDWVVWDGSPYGQFNPTQVGSDGTFAWYVPDGSYYVAVQARGFESTRSSVLSITNSIINPSVLLVATEEDEEGEEMIVEVPSTQIPSQPARAPETIAQAIVALAAQPIAAAQETLETIRELPGVEAVAEISTPTLAVAAGASVVTLAVAFDFLPFLQYFFTAPVLLFWRRKRKSYGVVYNAIAKTPVDLAVVRLYQVSDEDEAAGRIGRLVKSRVTDKGGRYFFLVSPGKYRLVATKVGYQFPTEYLKGDTIDGKYLDVYHGEPIVVGSSGAVLTANVPMDPSQSDKFRAPSAVMFQKRLRFVQHVVAGTGLIAAAIFAIVRPNAFTISMIGIQVVMYLLVRRLAKPRRPISWGIVYDKMTGRPIAQAVARIFEPKYNKVLETQVTDSRGRYAFLLGPNEYFAMFEKRGYTSREVRPINYSKNEEPKDFSDKVALDPSQRPQQE